MISKTQILSIYALLIISLSLLLPVEILAGKIPIPKFYGVYLVANGKLIELKSTNILSLSIHGFKEVPSTNTQDNKAFFIVYKKEWDPEGIAIYKCKFIDKVAQFVGTISINRWVPDKEIKLKAAPIEGKIDMYKLIPEYPLAPGVYLFPKGYGEAYGFTVRFEEISRLMRRIEEETKRLEEEKKKRPEILKGVNKKSIKNQIQQRRKILMDIPPPYLFEATSFSGAVTTVWTRITAPIIGQNLIESYDKFYFAALDYNGLANQSLNIARDFMNKGDVEKAKKYIKKADRYIKLFHDSNKAAIEVYNNNLDVATELANGIYRGSKASTIYGAKMVLGPWGNKVIDALFMTTDFAIDQSEVGLNEATKNLLSEAIVKAIFKEVKIESAGNKTFSEIFSKATTKTVGSSRLYPILDEIFKDPEMKKALMKVLAESTAIGVKETSKEMAEKMLTSYSISLEGIGQIPPTLSTQVKKENLVYEINKKLNYNIRGWDAIIESVTVLNNQTMAFNISITNNTSKNLYTWIPKNYTSTVYLTDNLGNKYPVTGLKGATVEPKKTRVYRGKTIKFSYIFLAPKQGATVFTFNEERYVFKDIDLKPENAIPIEVYLKNKNRAAESDSKSLDKTIEKAVGDILKGIFGGKK